MGKITIFSVFLLALIVPFGVVGAQSVEDEILDLERQIRVLQARIQVLRSKATTTLVEVKKEATLLRDHDWEPYQVDRELRVGLSTEDVELLQEFLGSDSSLYPERIATGYFGSLTAEAIKRFQKKNNLREDGIVSGQTKEKLNIFLKEKGVKVMVINGKKKYCAPYLSSSSVVPKKNGAAVKLAPCQLATVSKEPLPTGKQTPPPEIGGEKNDFLPEFYYVDTFDISGVGAKVAAGVTEKVKATLMYAPSTGNLALSPVIQSSNEWQKIHSFSLLNLLPGTTYNAYVSIMDGDGHYATSSVKTFKTISDTDTTAPAVSQVRVSEIGTSSVLVSWKTSEPSSKKIYYAPKAEFSLANARLVRSDIYTSVHALRLEKLTAATPYSFVIESEDVKKNRAQSEVWMFTTSINDSRPPEFVSVLATPLSSREALVTVVSDELSVAMIHFGTSNPLDLGSSRYVVDGTLSKNHSFPLNNLSAGTNYRFIVSLKDALGNIGTSSVGLFQTK
jgi:hypothetical protein